MWHDCMDSRDIPESADALLYHDMPGIPSPHAPGKLTTTC